MHQKKEHFKNSVFKKDRDISDNIGFLIKNDGKSSECSEITKYLPNSTHNHKKNGHKNNSKFSNAYSIESNSHISPASKTIRQGGNNSLKKTNNVMQSSKEVILSNVKSQNKEKSNEVNEHKADSFINNDNEKENSHIKNSKLEDSTYSKKIGGLDEVNKDITYVQENSINDHLHKKTMINDYSISTLNLKQPEVETKSANLFNILTNKQSQL